MVWDVVCELSAKVGRLQDHLDTLEQRMETLKETKVKGDAPCQETAASLKKRLGWDRLVQRVSELENVKPAAENDEDTTTGASPSAPKKRRSAK